MYGSPWPGVYANVSERDIRPTISRSGTRRRVSCVLQSEDKLPAGAGPVLLGLPHEHVHIARGDDPAFTGYAQAGYQRAERTP
jgi:hypothetical protein